MKKYLVFIILLALAGSALSGCRSGKSAAGGSAAGAESGLTAGGETGDAVAGQSLDKRYANLTGSWKDWTDMEVNVKVQLTSPAKLNASGKAWMKRGEWIYISMRMLGFEVATLWIDKDSIVAVDKFHKKYVSEPTATLLANANVTIEDIQDMLLGRAFVAGKGTATEKMRGSFDLEQADNGWYLLPREQPRSYTYGFLASNNANALRGAVVEVSGFGSVEASYADIFETRGCGWFAQEVKVENTRGRKIAATLRWDLNGAKFNTGIAKRCNIPGEAERITMQSLTTLLKSL